MTSRLMQAVHETAEDFASIGLIDVQTMREFDVLCLPPIKTYSPEEIKALRLSCLASQRVFAAYLNTSPSTIQKWEQGVKHPNGPSLKLLNLVARNGLEILA